MPDSLPRKGNQTMSSSSCQILLSLILSILLLCMPSPSTCQDSLGIKSYIPQNIEEAIMQLDKLLPDSAKIRLKNKYEIGLQHFGIGLWMRNNWGLWAGSRLARYFDSCGARHPDDMSGIILTAYHRHLLSRPLKFEELCRKAKETEDVAKRGQEEFDIRAQESIAKISRMMMNVHWKPAQVDTAEIPPVPDWGKFRNRYVARFNHGLLLAMRSPIDERWAEIKGLPMQRPPADADEDYIPFPPQRELVQEFDLIPYYLDLQNRTLHKVEVTGLDEIYSTVVVDSIACFAGMSNNQLVVVMTDGHSQHVRILPDTDRSVQLGSDGKKLLAIYRTIIYRLDDDQWVKIYDAKLKYAHSTTPVSLPKSGIPPRLVGNRIYFRDEGNGENDKSLWCLELGDSARLTTFDMDIRVGENAGPRWENNPDYLTTPDGGLWVTCGEYGGSLIRRDPDGEYKVAIVNGCLRWSGRQSDIFEPGDDSLHIFATGLARRSDGSLLLICPNGLYELRNDSIKQLIAFSITTYPFDHPSKLFILNDDRSFFVSDEFGYGIFILAQDRAGKYKFTRLDNNIGAAIRF